MQLEYLILILMNSELQYEYGRYGQFRLIVNLNLDFLSILNLFVKWGLKLNEFNYKKPIPA